MSDDAPEDLKKPPEGVLAEQILKSMPTDPKDPARDPALDTPSQAEVVKADPNYLEPYSHAAFQAMADSIMAPLAGTAGAQLSFVLEQQQLIKFLLARIAGLEKALMPFALSALVMSNARMCLIADGRPTEPAGGTWVSNVPGGIQLQPNEGYFFNACDAIGRQRTNDHISDTLQRMRDAQTLQKEKDAAVESGAKVH